MKLLKFSKGNAKLSKKIFSVSLPSGHTCPHALKCLTKADRETGKLTEGKDVEYRCFSATQENVWPKTRKQRWHNYDVLNGLSVNKMVVIMLASLPKSAEIIRLHVAGDFFSQKYFDAWMNVAKMRPDLIIYTYTKALNFWIKRMDEMPRNFVLTASRGGKLDHLIDVYNLKQAEVVLSYKEAEEKGIPIDHDDSYAYNPDFQGRFGLIIHGTQPAGSDAMKALMELKKTGFTGYSRNKGTDKNAYGKKRK